MEKDDFDGIECEHLLDANISLGNLPVYPKACMVASGMAGHHVPAIPANCRFCLSCDNPKSDNGAVIGLVKARLLELKKYTGSKFSGPKKQPSYQK